MKHFKCMMLLFLFLGLSFALLPIRAYAEGGSCGENAIWSFDKGCLTISGTGDMNITPPGHIAGAVSAPWYHLRERISNVIIEPGITSISEYAFWFCTQLTSISIPETVTKIGNNAFNECQSLQMVKIPSGVTRIEDDTFANCFQLTEAHIPEGVTFIGSKAFSGCGSLRSISIPHGVTIIEDSAFSGCRSLTEIVLHDGITAIGWHAFQGCSALTSLTLPPNLQYVGDYAFAHCTSLVTLTIPNSLERIGWNAFTGCSSLEEVHISDLFDWCTMVYGDIQSNPLRNGAALILNGEPVVDLVLPESLTHVPTSAFYGCESLESVTIPEGYTSIGSRAFAECKNLTDLQLPSTLTTIERDAFSGCAKLRSVGYGGTEKQLFHITAYQGNEPLLSATWTLTDKSYLLRRYRISRWGTLGGQLLLAGLCVLFTHKRRKN